MTAEQLPQRQTDIIASLPSMLAPYREIILDFVYRKDATAPLAFRLMHIPNRHTQLRIVATTLGEMLTAASAKELTPTGFQRKFNDLRACDPKTDEQGYRNFWLIASVIRSWANSGDTMLNQRAQQLCEIAGANAMESLDYPDITFCPPQRFATYLSNSLFNFGKIESHKAPLWKSAEFTAQLNFLINSLLDRDNDFDPEEDPKERDASDFVVEVKQILFDGASPGKVNTILRTLQTYGGDSAENLLTLWGYGEENDEDGDSIDLDDL